MHPVSYVNPPRRTPYFKFKIIAINVLIIISILLLPAEQVLDVCVPFSNSLGQTSWDPLVLESFLVSVRNVFIHFGLLHLHGNILNSCLFGGDVDDRKGVILDLFFYVFTGFAALTTQILIDLHSNIPFNGASCAMEGTAFWQFQ